jgi:myo-inositol 2-dehydrogenase / D-chiro-inositol 1-dehydrogenase
LKVALIGSGARGTGAVRDAIQTEGPVELVAMADVFRDKIDTSYSNLMNLQGIRDYIKVPEEQKFVGLDSYKQAIDLADVVILASPPAFRPFHFEYAVRAGKHVFMEKPLASDAPGVRKMLAAGEGSRPKRSKSCSRIAEPIWNPTK